MCVLFLVISEWHVFENMIRNVDSILTDVARVLRNENFVKSVHRVVGIRVSSASTGLALASVRTTTIFRRDVYEYLYNCEQVTTGRIHRKKIETFTRGSKETR